MNECNINALVICTGILTKPDLVDKGTEATVVKTVHNELIPLKKGYMIVKCRGQQEILDRVSLSEAMEREKTFFEEHAHFRSLTEFCIIKRAYYFTAFFLQ